MPRISDREHLVAEAAAVSADAFALIDRIRFQEREEVLLAPYAMRSSQTRGRAYPEAESPYRTCFQRDRDRIVHSTAFRRLEYKTQVFVNHEGDHYRTRLTHTLEVAQIARSIARGLALNEDLVEAVALVHDLGHPPFGHAGEEALDALMREHGGFDHNLQSLRVVECLERRYPGFEGLNLSWELRESIAKHGEPGGRKLPAEYEPEWGPLLEAQLVDVADSLAYSNHDIDDGLRSSFISVEELRLVPLWAEAEEAVKLDWPRGSGPVEERILVARTVSQLIDLQVCDLQESTLERLSRREIRSLDGVRLAGSRLVDFSSGMKAKVLGMQDLLMKGLYRHYRTVKMAEKAKRFVEAIFREYLRDPRQLPPTFQRRAEADGFHRAISDYLAGMTDRFCQEEYCRLFHPYERV
jgi:dGTPase